jgi:peptidoglycan/LPS O-acetylase OafA/YrhL
LKYRREIDGLRAIAIISVLMFHANMQPFSGGYVGVDVFFVISGYLITTILAAELEQGTYSIVSFYERRARRILPALFAMLAVTLPFGYMLLNPADLVYFAKSLLGSVLFLANITSYLQSGYFDAASDVKPLMHLWSLAIEEQYYVVFPLLLAAIWRLRLIKVFLAILLCSLTSLGIAEFKLDKDISSAFFYLHSRAWELGVGALLALSMMPQLEARLKFEVPLTVRQLLAFLGLAMIIFSIVGFGPGTRFPGASALVPTVGAALVIACATQHTLVGRLLGTRYLVGVGLISYSAYLWHQPIFAFVRYQSPNHLSTPVLYALILLTLGVAYLSWRFVEAPFRQKGRMTRKTIAIISLVGIVFFSAIAIISNAKQGFPERYPKEFSSAFDPPKVKEGKFCDFKKLDGFEGLDACVFGDVGATSVVLLYGDSHASSLLGELDEEFKTHHVKGLRVRLQGCDHSIPGMVSGPITNTSADLPRVCLRDFDKLLAYLRAYAEGIVVSVRWTAKMYPVTGQVESWAFDNQEGGIEYRKNASVNFARSPSGAWVTDGDAKRQAVWDSLSKLIETQKRVLVVYPVPEVGWDVPAYNFSTYLQTGKVNPDISTSYALYKQRNRFVIDTLDDKRLDAIVRIRPEYFFCKVGGGNRCMAQVAWRPYYYDSNHLASEGAKPIAQEVGRSFASH